jgi:hypothetical protein
MERSLRSRGPRRVVAGLLVAAVMAFGGSAVASGAGQGHAVRPASVVVQGSSSQAGDGGVALSVLLPEVVIHPLGIRWS